MRLMDLLRGNNIDSGVEQYRNTSGAVLLDVRERDEYAEGRIPGSVNMPLSQLESRAASLDKAAPIYVYCLSGGRSSRAAAILTAKGFANVKNIGGISGWKGELEK